MDTIARIRQEIEERKKAFQADVLDGVYPTYYCALLDIEDFLDTLSVEPDKNLEEAAGLYADNQIPTDYPDFYCRQDIKDAFIAGAEWQRLKDKERR